MNNLSPTVKNLIIINVLMFALGYALPILLPHADIHIVEKFGLYYISHPYFQPYQFFTHFFIHADVLHIAFNMISLYSIGSLLERVWGSKRLLNYYLICGLGAGIFYTIIQALMVYNALGHLFPSEIELENVWHIMGMSAVGASGAVFGLFTAVALLFPNSEFFIFFIPFPIKAKYLLIAAVIISLGLGMASLKGDQVAHFAHLGGIITGYVMTKFFNKNKYRFY